MVRVIYDGNLGNWLFQYCFGRILAERLGYKLDAPPVPGMSCTYETVPGADYSHLEPTVLRGQNPDLSFLENPGDKRFLLLTGYFQRAEYYLPWREEIKRWLTIDDVPAANATPRSAVVSMRRGRDYIPAYGLPLSYYDDAMTMLDYDEVYLCTNEPDDPFVKRFSRKYSAIVRPGSFQGAKVSPNYLSRALDNLGFIAQFDQIVMSNSSFAWWGAFLSNAHLVIGPRPARGMWAAGDPISRGINLEVPGFRFIDCAEYRSEFLSEAIRTRVTSVWTTTKEILVRTMPFLRGQPAPSEFEFRDSETRN